MKKSILLNSFFKVYIMDLLTVEVFMLFKRIFKNFNSFNKDKTIEKNIKKSPYEDAVHFQSFKATVFLDWAKDKKIYPDEKYPKYFFTDLSLDSPSKFHREMIEIGFLRPLNLEEALFTLKATELKSILKSFNIKATGTKAQLVEKVLTSTDYTLELEIYTLTSLGENYIVKNKYLIDFYKSKIKDISLDQFILYMKNSSSDCDFYGIIDEIYCDKFNLLLDSRDYESLRISKNNYFKVLNRKKETKEIYKDILFDTALEIIVLDIYNSMDMDKYKVSSYYKKYFEKNFDLYKRKSLKNALKNLNIKKRDFPYKDIKKGLKIMDND